MSPFKTVLAASALLTASAGVSAHEFWLQPTAYRTTVGKPLGVYVCNGSGYEGWSLPRDARRIEKFVALGTDDSHPVVGHDGSEPAGFVRFTTPGGYVIALQTNRVTTVQTDEEFDDYLREKGLDAILARRIAEGHRGGRVRESYSRYAKALVKVEAGAPDGRHGVSQARDATSTDRDGTSPGGAGSVLIDRAVGLPLELVADAKLFSDATAGDLRTFRVLHDGKPLAGVLVAAMRPGTTDTDLTARTDRDGRVKFKLDKRGAWRIAAVHMVAPPAGVDASWDSLWASLTFELPSSSPAAVRATNAPRDERCRNQIAPPALQAQR